MSGENSGVGSGLDANLFQGAPAAYDPTIKCVKILNTEGPSRFAYVTALGKEERLLKALRGNPKLPQAAKDLLRPFQSLACFIVDTQPPSAERSAALRFIRQAKDCVVGESIPDVADEE